MEAAAILADLAKALTGTGLPKTVDLRGKLVTNANAKRWRKRKVEELKGMVWHQALGWGSVENVAKYHTGPDSHLAKGGVESIAYSWAVRTDGQIALCNDLDRAVWSQGYAGRPGDENAEFLSVMFAGLFHGPGVTDPSAGQPTDAQLVAGLLLWRTCAALWGWSGEDLYGHYHFGKPACPGNTLQGVIECMRTNVAKPKRDFSSVKGRQKALKDLGFYNGRVDGIWGPRSRGALIRFQLANQLAPDGVWKDDTSALMVTKLAA